MTSQYLSASSTSETRTTTNDTTMNNVKREVSSSVQEALQQKTNRMKVGIGNLNWANDVANSIIKTFPEESVYTLAAGISPSGIVHFGNFRDVMTCLGIHEALKAK